ncbi:MAG: helix-turn-helix domain-containing protein [Bacillota bacterium]
MSNLNLLELYQKSMEGMLDGKGLPYICLLLSKKMNCPVIIVDDILRVIVYQDVTGEGPALGEFFDPLNQEVKLFRKPIGSGAGNGALGELILLTEQEILELEQTTLEAISQVIAIQMAFEKELLSIERQYRDEFVYDVLHNNISTRQTMIRRGKFWGWDLHAPYSVIIIKPSVEKKIHIGVTLEKIYSLISSFVAKVEGVDLSLSENEIVLLFRQMAEDREHKQFVLDKLKDINTLIKEKLAVSLNIGVGSIQNSMELYRSYHEAKQAILVRECLGDTECISFYEDSGIMRLLLSVGEYQLKTFAYEHLGPLLNLDKANSEELITTLNVYFDNDEELGQASKALFIHLNTLKYRLNKIQELLGINLKNLENKLNLFFALKCYKIQMQKNTTE